MSTHITQLDQTIYIPTIPEPTSPKEVLQFLERIGRTCYKSENRITTASAPKFIANLRDAGHWAMLEHYIFVIQVPESIYRDIYDVDRLTSDNYDLVEKMNYIRGAKCRGSYIISASATALNYIWNCNCYAKDEDSGFQQLCLFMKNSYPELMKPPVEEFSTGFDENIKFITKKELQSMDRPTRTIHDWFTVRFITDRAIANEIVRHRPASFAQESTRYCAYDTEKFLGGRLSVISPVMFKENPEEHARWEKACTMAMSSYIDLRRNGASPQEARTVLPLSTKTELVMTARLGEWEHFFRLRCDSHAHPQMQQIARMLLAYLQSDEYWNKLDYLGLEDVSVFLDHHITMQDVVMA